MSDTQVEPSFSLTLEEFTKYKDVNESMLPSLRDVANNMNFKVRAKRSINGQNDAWRKEAPSNSWILQNKLKQTEDGKLESEFRGILNKLSNGNFHELAKELISLNIKTKEQLVLLVNSIFAKAITEPTFCDMYAKLSKELVSYYIEEQENCHKVYFRELLINKCQMMFTESISISKDMNNNVLKTKEQVIGCITFIGELYNNELLTDKVIFSCFKILFVKVGTNKEYVIDNLCTLIKIVGKNFNAKSKEESKMCYDKFTALKDSKDISMKDKFTIMDVLDLLKNLE